MTTTRWQSSQQPLFVRTVWVKGRRHAILSRDDPLLQFPTPALSSNSSDNSSDTSSCCQLEDCLIKLRLALRTDSYQDSFHGSPYPIRQGSVESSECYKSSDQEEEPPPGQTPLLGRYPEVFTLDSAAPPPAYEPQLNPLSERVLQWLDLSGRGCRLPSVRPSEPPRERRKVFAFEIRKTLKSRQRELTTKDLLANLKLSARSKVTHEKRRRSAVSPPVCCSPEEVETEGSGFEEPTPEELEPPRLLRSSWPQPSSPVRPQLHIFMPPLADEPNSEGEGLDLVDSERL